MIQFDFKLKARLIPEKRIIHSPAIEITVDVSGETVFEYNSKICSICTLEKDFKDFNNRKSSKDGKSSVCRLCEQVRDKERYCKRKDHHSSYNKMKYKENSDAIKKKALEYHERNKDNPDYIAKRKQYYRDNKVAIENKKRLYEASNRAQSNALKAKYRASKIKATPKWLTEQDKAQIVEFYECCQMFRMYTGIDYQVDHIVPLQSELVCGLHVPWNLQVLTAFENNTKNNSFNTDQ